MRSRHRYMPFCIVTTMLAGCATDAQRRAQGMRATARATFMQAAKCMAPVNADPKYVPLWVHTPKPPSAPSMAQLADGNYATASEVVLLENHRDALLPCRTAMLNALAGIDARLTNTFSDVSNSNDMLVLAVAQGKLTWGVANQQLQDLRRSGAKALLADIHQIDAELQQENAAELAHRAQVANAIGQALGAAAQAAVVAAAAAQAARPVVTTCSGGPYYASCVTRQ